MARGGSGLLIAACCLALVPRAAPAQGPAAPAWQTAAGGTKSFEVASVKLDPSPFRPPNFPLDAGDGYRAVGGRFSADFPLLTYITFAYKVGLAPSQRQALLEHLPAWVATDRYAIDARAEGNPTKDQMRLMMQALLAERFQLTVHFETQVVPVLAMILAKPGKTGPKLRPHSEGPPCEATPPTNEPRAPGAAVFPPYCDTYMMDMRPNALTLAGSRHTTMAALAGALPGIGRLDRPVVDQTGLAGEFDFTIEFAPEPAPPGAANPDAPPDLPGSGFIGAVREQLGLKLEPSKAPLPILVVDRVERPSEN